MNKGTAVTLILILLLAFSLRLYKITNPIADRHSWRQADTASVARNFIQEDWNILRPHIDNFAPVRRPDLPNDKRLFFAEFPFYSFLVALLYKMFGMTEVMGRLLSVFFSVGTVAFLYFLVRDTVSKRAGFLAAFFFAIIPFSVYYGRVFLPEPMMLFFSTGMVLFAHRWTVRKNWKDLLLASLCSGIAFLVKPYSIFLLLVVGYLFLRSQKTKIFTQIPLWVYGFFALFPLVAWRWYISHHEAGIPNYEWLFNQGNIRFTGAFFRWILFERFDKLILTFGGYVLFLCGLLLPRTKKEGWMYVVWLFSLFFYVAVFATGNVTHDYYQVIFLPIFSVFLAKGVLFIWDTAKTVSQKCVSLCVILFCVFSLVIFGWYEVKTFYDIQGGVDVAGKAVDRLTPKDALVMTGDSADVTLLYNTGRHGWAGGYASAYPNESSIVDALRDKGATHYVTTKVHELREPGNGFGQYMLQKYEVIDSTDQYIIFDLTKTK